jgi:hypothetical protein
MFRPVVVMAMVGVRPMMMALPMRMRVAAPHMDMGSRVVISLGFYIRTAMRMGHRLPHEAERNQK